MGESVDFEALSQRLRREEGYRREVYPDPKGIPTGGYGHNLEANPLRPRQLGSLIDSLLDLHDPLVDAILDRWWGDIFEDDVRGVIGLASTLAYWERLNAVRKGALLDMIFQMGWTRFRGFHRMDAALRRDDYGAASAEIMDSVYGREFPNRAGRNARRMQLGFVPDRG